MPSWWDSAESAWPHRLLAADRYCGRRHLHRARYDRDRSNHKQSHNHRRDIDRAHVRPLPRPPRFARTCNRCGLRRSGRNERRATTSRARLRAVYRPLRPGSPSVPAGEPSASAARGVPSGGGHVRDADAPSAIPRRGRAAPAPGSGDERRRAHLGARRGRDVRRSAPRGSAERRGGWSFSRCQSCDGLLRVFLAGDTHQELARDGLSLARAARSSPARGDG